MVSANALRVQRGLLSLAVIAALYAIAAHVGALVLPQRIWMGTHYIDDLELVPTYRSIAEEAMFLVRAGILLPSAAVSTGRVAAGVAAGTIVGVPLGLAMARSRLVEWLAEPTVAFFRFTPVLALLPLYVLWFGFGEMTKILLIATGVAVIMLHGTFEGVRRVPRVYVDAAIALGARRGQILARVVLPSALPHVVSSIRIATAVAWVAIVVAEMIKPGIPSLGYLLALAGAYPRVPTIVVGLATVAVLVLLSDAIVVAAYHRATRWMRRHRG